MAMDGTDQLFLSQELRQDRSLLRGSDTHSLPDILFHRLHVSTATPDVTTDKHQREVGPAKYLGTRGIQLDIP